MTTLHEPVSKAEVQIKEHETLHEQSFKVISKLKRDNAKQAEKIAALEAELAETLAESQAHCNSHQEANDELAKEVDELHGQILSDEDWNFFLASKADVVMQNQYDKKRILTLEELKGINFPMELLEAGKDGVRTTNYSLAKISETEYKLDRN